MDLFQIHLDSSSFSPGSGISGFVLLKNGLDLRNLQIGYLGVRCNGVVRTGWRRKKDEKCEFSSETKFLEVAQKLWDSTVHVSNHYSSNVFHFHFLLPPTCPPSHSTNFGSIQYSIHVELDKGFRLGEQATKEFEVPSLLDLNSIPSTMTPISRTSSGHHKKLMITIPKSGYYPGDLISISIKLESCLKNRQYLIDARIIQRTLYTAFHHRHDCDHKTTSVTVAEKTGILEESTEMTVEIPKFLVASFNVNTLRVEYVVQVELRKKSGSVTCEVPILIGADENREDDLPPAYQMLPPPPSYS